MAGRHQSTSELSLRHRPGPSEPDISLSFEIPFAISSADLLLADNSDDFLNGVDCSLTTPPPPKRTLDAPLTLSELTPTPRAAPVATVPTPSPSLHRRNTKSPEIIRVRFSPQKTPQSAVRPRLDMTKIVDSPVSAERFANLQAEVDSLGRDSTEEVEPPKLAGSHAREIKPFTARSKLPKGDERKPRTKATVIDGGVAKKGIRNKLPLSNFSRDISVASRQPKPVSATGQALIRPVREFDKITAKGTKMPMTDEATTNVVASDGAADRLVLFSQRLMTKGLFSFDNVGDSEDNARNIAVSEQVVSPSNNSPSPSNPHNHDVFTLSQISPSKVDSSHSAVKPAPQSPTLAKTGAKRPISAISDLSSLEPRKKGKLAPVRRSSKPNVPVLQPSTLKNIVASSSKLPSGPNSRTRLGPQIRQALALKGKDIDEPTTSGAPGHSRHQKRPKIVGDQRTSKFIKPGTSSAIREQTAPLPPAEPTKPYGFTFRSDIRLEARNAGLGEKVLMSEAGKRTKSHHAPIPDFKSLHAAELQASLAFRKEHVAPTVPITPELKTKFRAKERERFDDMVKRKEEEMDRIKDEQRKAREEEEEIEIKELRKRAIPKANEVPKWYENAPKRGGSVHS